MKQVKKTAAWILTGAMALGAFPAGAETTFEGSVVSGRSVSITAPFGGTISEFSLRAGERITAEEPIAEIETTKVYAPADGTITGLFGQAGDSVEDVTARYGTVLYIAPQSRYSIDADIEKAYNSSQTRYVDIGEEVYIVCTADGKHTARGVITAVSGTSYTVQTSEGELLMGETVSIYRGTEAEKEQRIGRGSVSRTSEIQVSASGSILKMHVKDGDIVQRGDLLFETVTGTLDGLYAVSNTITPGVDGIVASIDTEAGASVQKGETLLTVYPLDSLQAEISISEYDLPAIQEGDTVQIAFNWDEEGQSVYEGTVATILHLCDSEESEAVYKGYVDFVPSQDVRLGMTVVVSTLDGVEASGTAQLNTTAEAPVDEAVQGSMDE